MSKKPIKPTPKPVPKPTPFREKPEKRETIIPPPRPPKPRPDDKK